MQNIVDKFFYTLYHTCVDKNGNEKYRKEIKLVDTEELEKRIKESGKTKTFLAKKLNISRMWLGAKINNKTPFNNLETDILCKELSITRLSDKEKIFFKK